MTKKELFNYLDLKCAGILDSINAFDELGRKKDVKDLWYTYDLYQNLMRDIDGVFGKKRIRSY